MVDYHLMCSHNFGSDTLNNQILFRYQDGKVVQCDDWRREFDKSLRYIGIEPIYPTWRVNSLRHGEITDQLAAGIPYQQVQQFARHAIGSRSTWIYSHTSSREQADIANKKLTQYLSNL